MAIFGDTVPTVPRDVYDREKDRADKAEERADYLLRQLVSLKKKGFEAPAEPRQGRVVPPKADADSAAAKRMHTDLVERMAEDIENLEGVPKDVARAEAERMRKAALGEDLIP